MYNSLHLLMPNSQSILPQLLFPLSSHRCVLYGAHNSCMHAKSLQLCPILCNPMNCSPPDSSVHGILQARILEWAAIPFSRGSSWPRDRTPISCGSCIAGGFFTTEPLGRQAHNSFFFFLFALCLIVCSFYNDCVLLFSLKEAFIPSFPQRGIFLAGFFKVNLEQC